MALVLLVVAGMSLTVTVGAFVLDGRGAQPHPTPAAAASPAGSPTTGPTSSPSPSLPTPAPTSPTPAGFRHPISGFLHPGILVTAEQLDTVRDHVRAGRAPWKRAFDRMAASEYADLGWQPRPREVVECGYFSNPNHGCDDEENDAVAAYTHALMWYLTGRPEHARKSIEILTTWATTLRSHTNQNAMLQAGWSAATFVRAAELVRYTYDGWSAADTERTAAMFRDVYLPLVRDGAPRSEGNWDLIILDAALGIAVYLDDRPLFDHVVQRWRIRLPAYIYLASDGARPHGSANWHGQTTFVDGLAQETCRDLGHTAWGLEAMSQIAETAWIQGVDLYAEAQPRLVAALEFHAGFALGDPVPGWLCSGTLAARFSPIPEIAYNHYHNRLGIPMPRTQELLESQRPQAATHFYAWGTLTHA
jgi:hypothetical protein